MSTRSRVDAESKACEVDLSTMEPCGAHVLLRAPRFLDYGSSWLHAVLGSCSMGTYVHTEPTLMCRVVCLPFALLHALALRACYVLLLGN